MHIVDEWFVGDEFETGVWISTSASAELSKLGRKASVQVGKLVKKVKEWARPGFVEYEGGGRPIRHEWDGVYRLGLSSSLFRLLGFYENDDKASFIVIDVYLKRGTQVGAVGQNRINAVAKVKRDGCWGRREL